MYLLLTQTGKYRTTALAKKYCRIWKQCIWNGYLLRKGRERRKAFARSMQDLARETKLQSEDQLPILKQLENKRSISALNHHGDNLPKPVHASSARILSGHSHPHGNESVAGQKRKRYSATEQLLPNSQQSKSRHHKRSNTSTSDIRPPGTFAAKASSLGQAGRPDPPKSVDFDLQRIRGLEGTGRTDTTQTDYFRLKALGIDPDTPIVPRTKEAFSAEYVDRNSATKTGNIQFIGKSSAPKVENRALSKSAAASNEKLTGNDDDSDEELFREMRRVKEAMADGITWFQEHKANDNTNRKEPARVGQERYSDHGHGTERKHTPSRTLQRVTNTGANGFWPPKPKALREQSNNQSEDHASDGITRQSSKPQQQASGVFIDSSGTLTTGSHAQTESPNDRNLRLRPTGNRDAVMPDRIHKHELPEYGDTSECLSSGSPDSGDNRAMVWNRGRESSMKKAKTVHNRRSADGANIFPMSDNSDIVEHDEGNPDTEDEDEDKDDAGVDDELDVEDEFLDEDGEAYGLVEDEDELSEIGQYHEAKNAVWQCNGRTKGDTAEDAIEL